MKTKHKIKLTLTSVYFTFFIDNLCWSIVFPIFAPFFLDINNTLFSPETSVATRTTILGFFLAAFSLGQFFGAPVLGEYADRHGRKKALALSVFFTVIGLGLSAWSMQTKELWLLFLSRLLTGIFASNMSICLACVTDLCPDEKTKVKNFGYLAVLAGISFIFGAFVGGKLSDPSLYPDFSYYLPLYLATCLSVINFFFILFGFRETSDVDESVNFDFLEGYHNIQKALRTKQIKSVYFIYFLFFFAWTILFQFTPVLMVRKFEFTSSNLGDLAIYMGICWAIGSGYLNKILILAFSERHILELCLVCFTVLCGLVVLFKHLTTVLLVLGFCVVIGGLAWPICTGVISNLAPRHMQGKILGISQSVQSLAMSVAPAIGGLAYQLVMGLPFLLAACASLVAGSIYFSLRNRIQY